MRVLIDYRPALRARTGVGEYLYQLVHALARRAVLQIVLFSSSWKDRLEIDAEWFPGVGRVDRRVPVRILNLAWHRLGWPPVERLAGPVDVVHSPSPLLVPSRRAAQVVTVNDLDFLRHPERVSAEIRRDYPPLAPAHVRRADAILTISTYAADQAVELLGAPADRLHVCPPGAPTWARPRPARPGPAGPVLFVGSLEPRKNVGTLLAAYRHLVDHWPEAPPLWLAGRITPAADPWLSEARRPPLAGRVTALGYVPETELRNLYSQAALLVLPSYDEGFGMTALEAMAIGVPVVAASRGAIPEVLGDAGLLVEGDDTREWAAALERVLRDQQLAATLSARGLERAAQFSWDATAERVEQMYRAAAARSAARRARTDGGSA